MKCSNTKNECHYRIFIWLECVSIFSDNNTCLKITQYQCDTYLRRNKSVVDTFLWIPIFLRMYLRNMFFLFSLGKRLWRLIMRKDRKNMRGPNMLGKNSGMRSVKSTVLTANPFNPWTCPVLLWRWVEKFKYVESY